jgi:hypothetical protein
LGPFLVALTEKMSAREKADLVKRTLLSKADVKLWQQIEARAKKPATALRSPKLRKASQIYHAVVGVPPELVLYLLYASPFKPVQDRLRNYFEKYLQIIAEITPEEWASIEAKPAKMQKAREEFVAKRLDRRPPPPPEEVPPPPEPAMMRRGGR